jgi:hypothetical protein
MLAFFFFLWGATRAGADHGTFEPARGNKRTACAGDIILKIVILKIVAAGQVNAMKSIFPFLFRLVAPGLRICRILPESVLESTATATGSSKFV